MVKINFETAAMILRDVSEDKKFVCNDGQTFFNLHELIAGLKKMGDDTFSYHVNNDRNDFSTWVYDVLGDVKLAEDLRKIKSRKPFIAKIKARITLLKKNTNGGS